MGILRDELGIYFGPPELQPDHVLAKALGEDQVLDAKVCASIAVTRARHPDFDDVVKRASAMVGAEPGITERLRAEDSPAEALYEICKAHLAEGEK